MAGNFKEIEYLRPVLDGNGNPVHSIGNFAVVFKMRDVESDKFYAVRCFHREQVGRADNYKLIEGVLDEVDVPWIVPFRYMENELSVASRQTQDTEFPVVLMSWVDGMTLGDYLRKHVADKPALNMLVYRFSQLAVWLTQQPFAHGDLKPDNIIVRPDGSLALVDYDAMFVPAMQGQQARELGCSDFRHPLRTRDDFDERTDDFPIISMLLSLKLIALHPEYLEKYGAAGRLLFSEKDYQDPASCRLLKEVLPSADAEVDRLASLFMRCHAVKNLANIPFVILEVEYPGKLSTRVWREDIAVALEDGDGVKYSQDRKRLLKCDNEQLKSYRVLESREIIGDGAFWGCEALTEILLPDSVTSIGNGAFEWCKSLTEITLPASVTFIGDRAFTFCEALTEITLPGSLTSIGEGVFGYCRALKKITLPNSVTSIGERAFSGCRALKEISFPDSVISIGDHAFCSCESLTEITLPASVRTISSWTFFACEALAEITLLDSVRTIGDWAFCGCRALKKISFPDSVISIGDHAFCSCESLTEITLPASVTSVGCETFGWCKSLTDITLPDSVRTIGKSAFEWCEALTEITLPASVTSIGNRAFRNCKALTDITFPDSVRTIGDWAFSGCEALTEISFPDSVISIGNGAFYYCI